MADIFDQAVAFLTENPDKIYDTWNEPYHNEGGILFQHIRNDNGDSCRCLTQIHNSGDFRLPPDLVEAIKADPMIPHDGHGITIAMLEHFAMWQRKIHEHFNRLYPISLYPRY